MVAYWLPRLQGCMVLRTLVGSFFRIRAVGKGSRRERGVRKKARARLLDYIASISSPPCVGVSEVYHIHGRTNLFSITSHHTIGSKLATIGAGESEGEVTRRGMDERGGEPIG